MSEKTYRALSDYWLLVTWTTGSQLDSLGGIVKLQIAGPQPRVSNSAGVWIKYGNSMKFPSGVNGAGPGTTLWKPLT